MANNCHSMSRGCIIIKIPKYSVQSLKRVRLLFEAIDNFPPSLKTSFLIFTNKCICFDLAKVIGYPDICLIRESRNAGGVLSASCKIIMLVDS